jgi:hypothetical protein
MTPRNWSEVASNLATHARRNFFFLSRGAVPVRLMEDDVMTGRVIEDGHAVVGVFGNDNYVADGRARREVEFVRNRLREVAAEEVGFGLSPDGYSWAMLIRTDGRRYKTSLGRAFQKELLKAFLEEAVERAWQLACGGRAESLSEVLLAE